jgi:hypothetical protein
LGREEEAQKVRPADSWRTTQQKAAVRKTLEEWAAEDPKLNFSVEEVMAEWSATVGDDVVEKQVCDPP